MHLPFTHKKLTDVKDSAAEAGLGETQEARFARGDLDAERTGVSHQRLKPGKRSPFGHKHDEADGGEAKEAKAGVSRALESAVDDHIGRCGDQ